jgi:ACT domain-containing protein
VPRVISHADVENASGTIVVDADTIVTPLAAQFAQRRGIEIVIGHGDDNSDRGLVRRVAGRVIDEVGTMDERVLETIVAEVLAAYRPEAARADSSRTRVGPNIDYCAMCLEQDRAQRRSRAVLTITGRNTKGIVARVTQRIAELGGDILDISQTLVGDYFTMIIIVDALSLDVSFADFKTQVEADVDTMGLHAMMIHEDVMESLHRV